ncbi:MAG: hypothetical protein AAGA46_04865 [Cyanobacteria bacterium P01_F01_bin.13]
METTHIGLSQSEPSAIVNSTGNDGVTIFVGTSVLIYVLMLFAFAPRQLSPNRRKSSL